MTTSDHPLILIVDDESKIRRLVAFNLEHAGYDTMSAADGTHALEAFAKAPEKPDLVLLDVMMPEMDGFETAVHLRKLSTVPIIFMTAKTDTTSKLKGFALGADDYVTKPFAMEELLARIRAVLSRAKPTAADRPAAFLNGPIELHPESRQCFFNRKAVHLTDVEFRLLSILMEEPGAVHQHGELLHKVWGPSAVGEVQHLRVAFARLRRKLEDSGLEGGIISAYSGVGYVLRDLRDEDSCFIK